MDPVDERVWQHVQNNLWRCIVCNDGVHHVRRHLSRHEQSITHQNALRHDISHLPTNTPPQNTRSEAQTNVHQALLTLLQGMQAEPSQLLVEGVPPVSYTGAESTPFQFTSFEDSEPAPSPQSDMSVPTSFENEWFGTDQDHVNMSRLYESMDRIIEGDDFWLQDTNSHETIDDSLYNDHDNMTDEANWNSTSDPITSSSEQRQMSSDQEWFPWMDKLSCTLDILMNIPRSVFSEKQLELIFWILRANGVNNVPSVSSMKRYQATLHRAGGIETNKCEGALGHTYYMNDIGSIIANEIANPLVCENIHWYPEDSGKVLAEAWQGSRWLYTMDPDLLTPMVRLGSKEHPRDFFIWEPVLLKDGSACIPVRWFVRNQKMCFRAYKLVQHVTPEQKHGWIVLDHEQMDLPIDELLLNLEEFRAAHEYRQLPFPDAIIAFPEWSFRGMDSSNGEPLAIKGKRSSGIVIHDLAVLAAGLPRNLQQQEYNVHFVCTSNLAPPLEMLDGIVDRLEFYHENGIPAWHAAWNEEILVIPPVLAVLGDNPMQSEMACHMGMRGKLFCRICMVSGREDAETMENDGDGNQSDASSINSARPSKRQRAGEKLSDMVDRIERFMKIGTLRTKKETEKTLSTIFDLATQVGTKTAIKNLKTEQGIKDTYQDFFLDQLFSSHKGTSGQRAEQLLHSAIDKLPINISSPIWRIKGLDPHRDTPVEVLHVVLLGVVKYFWRDLINRLKDETKNLLISRLSSLDVSGLGISPIAGNTLVRYAGSLTGRDFRIIAQVAPFVIHDLGLPDDCVDAWRALCALAPMIWQPIIEDKDMYCNALRAAINRFLICTARWTPQWFNKPKFHILLHLPDHILQFGPPLLFATECFESYNAVIRSKSVHTNRLAPSRDIGRAFAQNARIRHLLSGGMFPVELEWLPGGKQPNEVAISKSRRVVDGVSGAEVGEVYQVVFRSAANRVLTEINCDPDIMRRIGFPKKVESDAELSKGHYVINSSFGEHSWDKTLSARNCIPFPYISDQFAHHYHFRQLKSFELLNGDVCKVDSWVLARSDNRVFNIGKVTEILQARHPGSPFSDKPDLIAVAVARHNGSAMSYYMPCFSASSLVWQLFAISEILCVVNMQHHCIENNCDDSGRAVIRMEREASSQFRRIISHNNPGDLILNTSQFRSSGYILPFQVIPPPLDRTQAILQGATKVVASQQNMPSTPISTNKSFTGFSSVNPEMAQPVSLGSSRSHSHDNRPNLRKRVLKTVK
ncbi:hypothetical protein FRC02_001686 [Tulasnella sp. 418]|nr:hypothetical protein FRC02_001686 [Tulasnella sp. 418]